MCKSGKVLLSIYAEAKVYTSKSDEFVHETRYPLLAVLPSYG